MNETEQMLDEHAKHLARHDEQIRNLDLVIHGNDRFKIAGLVHTMSEMAEVLRELVEWRNQAVTYGKVILIGARVVLILLSLIAGGVWWPQISAVLKILGG